MVRYMLIWVGKVFIIVGMIPWSPGTLVSWSTGVLVGYLSLVGKDWYGFGLMKILIFG